MAQTSNLVTFQEIGNCKRNASFSQFEEVIPFSETYLAKPLNPLTSLGKFDG